jgi:hypothetical protein
MEWGRRGSAAAFAGGAPALAIVLAALLLAACTTSRSNASRPGAESGHRPAIVGRSGFKVHSNGLGVAIVGGPNSGVIVALPGAGGPAAGVSGGGSRPQIVLPPIPPARSTPSIAMPLDSYEQVAGQEQETLAAADDLLTQRCMQAKGFSYPVVAQPGSSAALIQTIEDSGYGVASLAQAETYGYGQPSQGTGPAGQSAGPAGLALPSFIQEMQQHGTAWTSALLGFVPGARASAPQGQGCYQVANAELYGPINGHPDPDPVPGLAGQAAQWTQSDSRVLAVERKWSRCMAHRGYRDNTPGQAQQHNWPTTPTPIEIATADADVACKVATNLVNTWLTVEAAYQQALITQNLTALSRLQANFGALLRRAEDLLQVPAVPISRG